MMGDLFSNVNVDLDLNLDFLDPAGNDNLDFLPEDLFDFIHEDLKEIQNGAIPDIGSLIDFSDNNCPVDEIQWDFDLDTTDFFKNTAQQPQQQLADLQAELPSGLPKLAKQSSKSNPISSSINKTSKSCNKSSSKSCNKSSSKSPSKLSKAKKSKQSQPAVLLNQNVVSPASTGYSTPNSPQSACSLENSSSDSNDFQEIFETYYSFDDNNNLVSHPIAELSIDELNNLSGSLQQQQMHQYDVFSESTFDLSNNFGGFVNMESALSLVNGASIGRQAPKLVTGNQLRRTKSKGTSLLANKPKSYKTIKKEMLQKKHSSLVSKPSLQLTSRLVGSLSSNRAGQTTTVQPTRQPAASSSSPFAHPSTTQITVIANTTFAQDHDYCSSIGSPF